MAWIKQNDGSYISNDSPFKAAPDPSIPGNFLIINTNPGADLRFMSFAELLSSGFYTPTGTVSGIVGEIRAWYNAMAGLPPLPANWVRCSGQVLNDPLSLLNGQTIPNLNGNAAGANTPGLNIKARAFLRGDDAGAGTGALDQMQGHFHNDLVNLSAAQNIAGIVCDNYNLSPSSTRTDRIGAPISDGINGTPRTGAETMPVNVTVIWIMCVR